ncbi:MAG TPA: hypothetical protein VGJ00_05485 [Rhabdochlamydiaceae bacterium]
MLKVLCSVFLALITPLLAMAVQKTNTPSIMARPPQLSFEQLFQIQNEIFQKIQDDEEKLTAIRTSPASLMEKWQQLLHVILPIQLEAIRPYHLGESQTGLVRFYQEYTQCAARFPALVEFNKEKWLFVFDKAFGITEFKEIPLESAQSMISAIANEMISEPFLQKVDAAVDAIPADASLIEKRQAILAILFPLHMSVMAHYGFEGEAGYIQAQRAIMDYYHDPVISQGAAYAQYVVFRRAHIL